MGSSPTEKSAWSWQGILKTVLGTSGLAIVANCAGLFQLLEGAILDRYIQIRPLEPLDERIVLIAIDERDINAVGRWPIPDAVLAELLERVREQQPRLIGLHLYRDIPVAPGSDRLAQVLADTPNLIGMEKLLGDSVAPPPVLQQLDRVALADMVVDPDGTVRRGLVSVVEESRATEQTDDTNLRLSFAAELALQYLDAEGIELKSSQPRPWEVTLGAAQIEPLRPTDGGYARIDSGGYQVLLNYRGKIENFQTLSMSDMMSGNVPPGLLRDRIALIGPTAVSLKEKYTTPYSNRQRQKHTQMSSLVIHANLTSQLVSAALDGRTMFRYLPRPGEWLWILAWAGLGTGLSVRWWRVSQIRSHTSLSWSVLVSYTGLCCFAPPAIGYALFLAGWWVPVVAPLVAAFGSIVVVAAYKTHNLQRLATSDGLTHVANRRYFELYLQRTWVHSLRRERQLSLIICDVDYFKGYNDTYGHRQGDDCLQRVAQAIAQSVRNSDVVARYGGEEFAIILPNTALPEAERVAERVGDRVRALNIPHQNSLVVPYVTLSFGVASTTPNRHTQINDLVETADRALYHSKKQGRNTCTSREL